MLGPSYGFPPLAVGWSLNYEMYFYVLLGLSMLFKAWRWFWLGGFLLFFVFVLPLLNFGYLSNNLGHAYPFSWPYLNLMCNPVLLFFLTGILAGIFYHRISFSISIRLANFLVFIGLVFFILAYTRIWLPFPGFWSPLFSCGFLLFACLLRDHVRPVYLPDAFVFPGDVSYSVYLIHPLLITGLPGLIHSIGLPLKPSGWIYFGIVLILIFILANYSHQVVEQRLGKYLSGMKANTASKAP
jgi:exopolysaccharide production protein ExoZ